MKRVKQVLGLVIVLSLCILGNPTIGNAVSVGTTSGQKLSNGAQVTYEGYLAKPNGKSVVAARVRDEGTITVAVPSNNKTNSIVLKKRPSNCECTYEKSYTATDLVFTFHLKAMQKGKGTFQVETKVAGKKASYKESIEVMGKYIDMDGLITLAESKVGSEYMYGGAGPDKFDSSHLVWWLYHQYDSKVTYCTSAMMARGWKKFKKVKGVKSGKQINDDTCRPGDLIVYDGHVGMYVGGGSWIHAKGKDYGVVKDDKISSAHSFKCILRYVG